MYLEENRDSSSSGPVEQYLINNGRLFALTKVVKIRSEVTARKKINSCVITVIKNVNNSGSTNCTLIKIEILAVPDPLNNIQLIIEGCLL